MTMVLDGTGTITGLVAGGLTDAMVTAADLSGAQTGLAPIYGARAWCTFDGRTTGTNAPIAGGNVTSVTRNSTGWYTINFTTAMPSTNYTIIGTSGPGGTNGTVLVREQDDLTLASRLTTSCLVRTLVPGNNGGGGVDSWEVNIVIFG